MSKERQSKLDPHTEELEQWFGEEKLTLWQASERLRERHKLEVSPSRLSDWWERRQQRRLHDQLLGRISSGARAAKEIEKQFAKDAPPELETLIKLHRVLIMNLAVKADTQPELIELVTSAMKPVLEWVKVQEKRADRELEREKFEALQRKAAQADQAKGVLEDRALSEAEKASRMRELFGLP